MDPILTFLRKIDSNEKVGVNGLGKSATSVANEMISRGILVKRIPENSRSFKYCISNRQLFDDYSKKRYPLGLYAEELEEKTREASAKSRRSSKKGRSKIGEEILLLKIFKKDAMQGKSLDVAHLQYQHFGIFAMKFSDSRLLAKGSWLTVENHETFHLIDEKNTSTYDGSILLSGQPTTKQINWLSRSSENGAKLTHFGDLDISAISHYLCMKKILGESIQFWLPRDLTSNLFRSRGSKILFNKQASKHSLSKMKEQSQGDNGLAKLIEILENTGCVIEQEMLHDDFLNSC
ncbi:MAG TPA: hypothetical protein EYP99_03675 [Candidatus Poseidoniales archaeon]|nr:hypothetical protein [Candidatus Poseidoniales archaeon]